MNRRQLFKRAGILAAGVAAAPLAGKAEPDAVKLDTTEAAVVPNPSTHTSSTANTYTVAANTGGPPFYMVATPYNEWPQAFRRDLALDSNYGDTWKTYIPMPDA